MEITTEKECIDKMLACLPLADSEAGLPETATLIRKLAAERDHMKAALEPFNEMAGELFARNYDADDKVLLFSKPDGGSVSLDFADFLVVRDALGEPSE